MKKILFISNIPTPYRNDFYNELGKITDLTVVYEAEGASNQGICFNWDISKVKNYNAIFLKKGDIEENKIIFKIIDWLKLKWDCIFVTNYSYRTEMVALLYLKIHHIPYVMEVDGGTIKKENLLKTIIKKILISGAKKYFSPSKQTDEFLGKYGAKEQSIVRYPFTPLTEKQILKTPISKDEKDAIKGKLGIKTEKVIVGVGQLIDRKGWDILLASACDIKADIYIIGEGKLRQQFEMLIKENNLKNVHLVGFLSCEETTKYYQAADIFVLPTRYDVWGLVINEALANGLPVITTQNCIAGKELIKDDKNGYLVSADDEKELYLKINTLLLDEELRKHMCINALNSIKEYTIENMVKVHKNVIYKID